jgi:hypothetical protein
MLPALGTLIVKITGGCRRVLDTAEDTRLHPPRNQVKVTIRALMVLKTVRAEASETVTIAKIANNGSSTCL